MTPGTADNFTRLKKRIYEGLAVVMTDTMVDSLYEVCS